MQLQLSIYRDGILTNQATFSSQELLDSFYGQHVDSFGEHEKVIEDITEKVEQEKVNEEARAYLLVTDWMVLRAIDDPSRPMSQEIKGLRAEARNKIK